MLTTFSFNRQISKATFTEPLSAETKKVKQKLAWLGAIAIIAGAFSINFRGIPGFITFDPAPPSFMISGILRIALSYYLVVFAIYLLDDNLKWKNDIIIQTTNDYWGMLRETKENTHKALDALNVIELRVKDVFQQIFFSTEFLESQDAYLKDKLGASYEQLNNYLNSENGVKLETFIDQADQPFARKLGDDGARYLINEKMKICAPEDKNLYAAGAYLMGMLRSDNGIKQFLESVVSANEVLTQNLTKFQFNNLGLTISQSLRLLFIEVGVPLLLAIGGLKFVIGDSAIMITEISKKLFE